MNLDFFNEQILVDCGCWAGAYKDGSGIEIEYCPTHKAAPELLEACEAAYRKEFIYARSGACRANRTDRPSGKQVNEQLTKEGKLLQAARLKAKAKA